MDTDHGNWIEGKKGDFSLAFTGERRELSARGGPVSQGESRGEATTETSFEGCGRVGVGETAERSWRRVEREAKLGDYTPISATRTGFAWKDGWNTG